MLAALYDYDIFCPFSRPYIATHFFFVVFDKKTVGQGVIHMKLFFPYAEIFCLSRKTLRLSFQNIRQKLFPVHLGSARPRHWNVRPLLEDETSYSTRVVQLYVWMYPDLFNLRWCKSGCGSKVVKSYRLLLVLFGEKLRRLICAAMMTVQASYLSYDLVLCFFLITSAFCTFGQISCSIIFLHGE